MSVLLHLARAGALIGGTALVVLTGVFGENFGWPGRVAAWTVRIAAFVVAAALTGYCVWIATQ